MYVQSMQIVHKITGISKNASKIAQAYGVNKTEMIARASPAGSASGKMNTMKSSQKRTKYSLMCVQNDASKGGTLR
jgi:hypothetical protein